MKKLFNLIRNSIKTKTGKDSSTRILAYLLAIVIGLFCLVFIGIEIAAAIISLKSTGTYVLSNEIIIIFGSILAHQLTLLGINKTAETSQHNAAKKAEQQKIEEPKTTTEEPKTEEPIADEDLIDP